jgi:hypothetical protein
MAKPGVVLKRLVGSDGPFGEHAELPTHLGDGEQPAEASRRPKSGKSKKTRPGQRTKRPIGRLIAFEREQKHRNRERAADSDEVARAFRDDAARGFRHDVAQGACLAGC